MIDIFRNILVITFIFFFSYFLFDMKQNLFFFFIALVSLGQIGFLNLAHTNEVYHEDNVKNISKVNFFIRFLLFFKRPSIYQTWYEDLEVTIFKNWFGTSIRYKKEISQKNTIKY